MNPIYLSIVTKPPLSLSKPFNDIFHAQAYTIGKVLSLIVEEDPSAINNPILITFDQRVRSSKVERYELLLEELNTLSELVKGRVERMAVYFYHPGGQYGFMSQWYPSWFREETGERTEYANCEQYMMAKKALQFGDQEMHREIMNTPNPSLMRRLGRQIRGFHENVWNEQKYEIVLQGNMLKFTQNEELKRLLIDTGDSILAEASPTDRIWGIGLSIESAERGDRWRGRNLLGDVLMEVRRRVKDLG